MNKIQTSRSVSRLAAVQVLYSLSLADNSMADMNIVDKALKDIVSYYKALEGNDELHHVINIAFLRAIVKSVIGNIDKIDTIISSNLEKVDSVHDIVILLRAILRCGISEILYFKTPYKVIISEYVGITKEFFSNKEVNFVNAILDKVGKAKNE